MTIFLLKLIALTSMLIDHLVVINPVFFSDNIYILIRAIGRIAFPLYVFVITESLIYTKNRPKFMKTLLLLALISQLPYCVYFGRDLLELNVLFTLSFGSLIVYNIDKYKNDFGNVNLFFVVISMILPLLYNSDYGIIGVYSVVLLYYIKQSSTKNIYSSIFLLMLSLTLYLNANIYYLIFGSLPALLVLFYNKKEGKKMKRFFHFSYPLHLTIYAIVRYLITL